MYLFDTDFVVEVLRGRLSSTAHARLHDIPVAGQHICTVTLSELAYGARRTIRPEYHIRMIETVLLPCVKVVAFDAAAAYLAGSLRARLEASGEPLSFPDLQIASMAIANDLVLVTGNTRHFARVSGLKLENWLADSD